MRRAWWPDDDEPDDEAETPVFPGVTLSTQVPDEGPEVVATLLGPDGEPISELLDRPTLPIGYALGPREPTRWCRYY